MSLNDLKWAWMISTEPKEAQVFIEFLPEIWHIKIMNKNENNAQMRFLAHFYKA